MHAKSSKVHGQCMHTRSYSQRSRCTLEVPGTLDAVDFELQYLWVEQVRYVPVLGCRCHELDGSIFTH